MRRRLKSFGLKHLTLLQLWLPISHADASQNLDFDNPPWRTGQARCELKIVELDVAELLKEPMPEINWVQHTRMWGNIIKQMDKEIDAILRARAPVIPWQVAFSTFKKKFQGKQLDEVPQDINVWIKDYGFVGELRGVYGHFKMRELYYPDLLRIFNESVAHVLQTK